MATLYLVDNIESEADPEFDAALFVFASNAKEAAQRWAAYYDRGDKVARVTEVPGPMQAKEVAATGYGVVDWSAIVQQTITI